MSVWLALILMAVAMLGLYALRRWAWRHHLCQRCGEPYADQPMLEHRGSVHVQCARCRAVHIWEAAP